MCKTWHLTYSCNHTFQIRLSKCRATVYTQSRPGRPYRPACLGGAALVFKKTYPCGDCASHEREKELSQFRERLGLGSVEREEAEAELLKQMFELGKRFPALQRRKRFKPLEVSHLPTKELHRGSLLRREVMREDVEVEEVDDEWTAYYEEWGTGWTTADDAGERAGTWESEGADDMALSETLGVMNDNIAFGQGIENPWAGSDAFTTDLTYASSWDTEQPVEEPPHGLEIPESSTPQHSEEQHEDQSTRADIENNSQSPLAEQPNGINSTSEQKAMSERNHETSKSTFLPLTDENFQRQENHKFKTLPPHLRRKIVSLRRRASDSNYKDTECDLLEQFKCFQLHTIITVST